MLDALLRKGSRCRQGDGRLHHRSLHDQGLNRVTLQWLVSLIESEETLEGLDRPTGRRTQQS